MHSTMQIGQLASRHQISVETIRFYERQGLMPKARRSTGNYRLYTDEHFERLNFILNCRFLDMSLDDIRTLLRLRNGRTSKCADVKVFVDEHVDQIERRIGELRLLAKQLKALRAGCTPDASIEACTILLGLDSSDKIRTAARASKEKERPKNGSCR